MMFVTHVAHGGTTDSGGDKSALSDETPTILSQTAPMPEVPLKDRLRKRTEAQGSSSFSTNTEDEDEDEDEGQGNKGTEDRTPSKPSPVVQKRGPGRPYKSTTPQGLPPTYHILLHAFYYFHHYHLGLLRTIRPSLPRRRKR
jgi:hypothetical protein